VIALRAASDPAASARQSASGAKADLSRQSSAAAAADLSRQSSAAAAAERFWPQWRGPYATGVSKHANPPTEWSETKNIRWKVEIPGRGSSSPVIWGDRLYVLSAVPSGVAGAAAHQPRGGIPARDVHRFVVLVDRRTGARSGSGRRPKRSRTGVAPEKRHLRVELGDPMAGASTPGSSHRACRLRHGRRAAWSKDLGDTMRESVRRGAPRPRGDRLVIVWDHLAGSFVVALDATNGRELWRQSRDEIDTWTPLVVEQARTQQAIVPGKNKIRSYDLETGAIVWESRARR
jgi:hypothetical protein